MNQLDDIQLKDFTHVYLLGIGGIGMSALALYFLSQKCIVGGYDKTPSKITDDLVAKGAQIHFDDLGQNLPVEFQDKHKCLVIRTPAVPSNHEELNYFQALDFDIFKRAEILGLLTRTYKGLGVAGTHGKTTTSSLLAHILNESSLKCSAFLGGISSNLNSNFLLEEKAEYTVIEADEFDRSFLQLKPYASIITSSDADHLDIYGDSETFLKGFKEYAQLIDPDGILIVNDSVILESNCPAITYGKGEKCDYQLTNIRYIDNRFLFDLKTPTEQLNAIELGVPGIHNAENAVACVALCDFLGVKTNVIIAALKSFKGVKRRFDCHYKTKELIYIDDYAHHPTEIKALLDSVDLLYPNKRKIGVFQPHLFTRTRDFFNEFAAQLSRVDELILLPIYPAREEPIDGISSDELLKKITGKNKKVLQPHQAVELLSAQKTGVLLTFGAGDIDRIVESITTNLHKA
jgi:UDP-N-acetylmuramate--alanine ligase